MTTEPSFFSAAKATFTAFFDTGSLRHGSRLNLPGPFKNLYLKIYSWSIRESSTIKIYETAILRKNRKRNPISSSPHPPPKKKLTLTLTLGSNGISFCNLSGLPRLVSKNMCYLLRLFIKLTPTAAISPASNISCRVQSSKSWGSWIDAAHRDVQSVPFVMVAKEWWYNMANFQIQTLPWHCEPKVCCVVQWKGLWFWCNQTT